MTLLELQTEVALLTNRPDLTANILSAVRAATLKLHQLDYFYKDLFETGITFPTDDYLQQLEYRTLLPRWRALKYIRKTDVNSFDDGDFLEVIPIPEFVEDQYKANVNDVCYVAGDVIQIRSSTKLQYIILGCYLQPDITVASYKSWIADDHPYAIVYEASALIFKQVGDTDQFAAFTQLAREEQQLIRISNIEPVGR